MTLDGETIGKRRLTPGHYRLEVHNWAGPPGNEVAIKLTFLNSAGKPGSLSPGDPAGANSPPPAAWLYDLIRGAAPAIN